MQVFAPFVVKRKRAILRVTSLLLAVICITVLLSQTVFAKNTYVITDGDQVKVYTTYATDPDQVLDQAGVELDDGDTYITENGDGVSEILIRRSQMITIHHCGEEIKTVSYGETLEGLLNRIGISLSGDQFVSMELTASTYDGMEVYIDRIVEVEEVYTVDIPYKTVYCYDPTLAENQQEVRVTGSVGQLQRRANVVYVDSVEESRIILEETVICQPRDALIAIGTNTEEVNKGIYIGDGFIVTETGEILTYYKVLEFMTTAYTKTDAGCDDITATGTYARVGAVAVDPKVVPYGTRMFIVSNDGEYVYGIATAEDCGGGVKNRHIDLYFDTTAECFQFGRRTSTVYFLG